MLNKRKFDLGILIPLLCFAVISLITIYSASTYISVTLGNLVFKQVLWYVAGMIFVMFLLRFKNDYLYKNIWLFYGICNLLLLLLLLFAPAINNSKCWFVIPGIGSFQPSEFMKIILILTLGVMIHNFKIKYANPSMKEEFVFLVKSFSVVLIPSVLTFLEPDTGVVIIYLVIYVSMLFLSGIRARWFLIAFFILALLLGGTLGLYFFEKDIFIRLFGTDLFYRLDRIFAWKSGSGLQLENAMAAIGSAGFLGHGFNQTPIYFPESGTDFIFAVFASNFGFIGSLALILLIAYFDLKVLSLTKKKIIDTDKYVLVGILGMLVFQQVQNIGMTVGIFPITGITLPFISYGGSSLLSYMVIVGIILNISLERPHHYRHK